MTQTIFSPLSNSTTLSNPNELVVKNGLLELHILLNKKTPITTSIQELANKIFLSKESLSSGTLNIDIADITEKELSDVQSQVVAEALNLVKANKETGIKGASFSIRFSPSSSVSVKAALNATTGTPAKVLKQRLALTLGDHFTDKDFAGVPLILILEYMTNFIKQKVAVLEKESKTQEQVNQLKTLMGKLERGKALNLILSAGVNPPKQIIDTAITQAQAALNALKIGESLFFPGGWNSDLVGEGHAIYYEATRSSATTFSLKFFTDDVDGKVIRHPQYFTYEPHKKQPFQHLVTQSGTLDGIPSENMLSPVFWQAFFEMNLYTQRPTEIHESAKLQISTRYGTQDIYEKLLPLLHAKTCTQLGKEYHFEKQQGNICTWFSLKIALLHLLPLNLAKRLIYDIQQSTLTDAYQAFTPENLAVDEQACSLLRKGVLHLSVEALELYKSNVIQLEDLEKLVIQGKNIITKVITGEQLAEQMREKGAPVVQHSPSPDASFSLLTDLVQPKQIQCTPKKLDSLDIGDISILSGNAQAKGTQIPPLFWGLYWEPKPQTLVKDLQDFLKTCKENIAEASSHVFQDILTMVVKLPIPIQMLSGADPFWSSIPKDSVELCISVINGFSRLLNEAFSALDSSQLLELQFIHLKGLVIIHRLASQSEQLPEDAVYANWASSLEPQPALGLDPILGYQQGLLFDYLGPYKKSQSEWIVLEKYFTGIHPSPSLIETGEGQWILSYLDANFKSFKASRLEERLLADIQLFYKIEVRSAERVLCLMADLGQYASILPRAYTLLKCQALIARAAFYKRSLILSSVIKHSPQILSSVIKHSPQPHRESSISLSIAGKIIKIEESPSDYDKNHESLLLLYKADPSDPKFLESNAIKNNSLPTLSANEKRSFQFLVHTPQQITEANPTELQIVKAIDYFAHCLFRLADRNITCFLRQLLFSGSALECLLKRNSLFAHHLLDFMQKGYQYFDDHNQSDGKMHMIYLTILLRDRLLNLATSEPQIKIALERLEKEGIDKLKHLNIEDSLLGLLKFSKKHQSEIHLLILYSWKHKCSELPDARLAQYLPSITASLAFVHAAPATHFFLHVNRDVQKISRVIFEHFKKASQDVKILAETTKQIVRTVGIASQIDWDKVIWDISRFPDCIGRIDDKIRCRLNLFSFSLVVDKTTVGYLPLAILKALEFTKNFPLFSQTLAKIYEDNVYEFLDTNQLPVQILCFNNGEIRIQRQFKINGPWYQYVKTSPLDNILSNVAITTQCTQWHACLPSVNPVIFCKTGTDQICYRLISQSSLKKTIIKEDHLELSLLPYMEKAPNPVHTILRRIEPPSHFLAWINSKSGCLHSIEMPRLGLSFQAQSQKASGQHGAPVERIMCDQVIGYWLSEKQYIPALKAFKNYLVLENAQGKKKVLIPKRPLFLSGRGGLISDTNLHEHLPLGTLAITPAYFEYMVNSQGQLEAVNPLGNLFYAYLLKGQNRYEESAFYLRNYLHELRGDSLQEKDLYNWFLQLATQLGDRDPKTYALHLITLAVKAKQMAQHHTLQDSSDMILSCVQTYLLYLQFSQYIGDLSLRPDEEITILHYLISNTTHIAKDYPSNHVNFILLILKSRLKALTSQTFKPTSEFSLLSDNWTIARKDIAFQINQFLFEFTDLISNEHTGEISEKNKEHCLPKLSGRIEEFLTYPSGKSLTLQQLYERAKQADQNQIIEFEANAVFHTLSFYKQFYCLLIGIAQQPRLFPAWKELIESTLKDPSQSVMRKMLKKAWDLYRQYIPKNPATVQSATVWSKAWNLAGSFIQSFTKSEQDNSNIDTASISASSTSSQNSYPPLTKALAANDLAEKTLKQMFILQPHTKLNYASKVEAIKHIQETIKEFSAQIAAAQTHNAALRFQLVKLANKENVLSAPSVQQREAHTCWHIARAGESVRPFKGDTIVWELGQIFLQDNVSKLKQRNPNLTHEDIQQLFKMLLNYLVHLTGEQSTARQQTALINIKTQLEGLASDQACDDCPEITNFLDKAVDEFSNKPESTATETLEHLAILLFETGAKIKLRKDQSDCIMRLAKNPFGIEQLIMGAGKSKVILPILAALKTREKHLAVIITPESSLATAVKDLTPIFLDIFGIGLRPFDFERSSASTLEQLEAAYRYLKEIRTNGDCLITTSKSLRCLSLKSIELALSYEKKPTIELAGKLQVFKQILSLLKDYGNAVIDEPHLILDVHIQTNFTLDEGVPLDLQRCQLTASLYEQLSDPELAKLAECRILDKFNISEKFYHTKIKPFLRDKAIQQEPFSSFFKRQPDEVQQRLLAFLNNEGTPETEKLIASSDQADAFALLKAQLNIFLPVTLSKHYCVDYGPSQKKEKANLVDGMLAKPYNGNNQPVESAKFLSPDVLMNYTLQTCYKTGIPVEEITRCVKELQNRAFKEPMTWQHTEAYRAFQSLCGKELHDISFVDCKPTDCVRIADRINASRFGNERALFFSYIARYILPKIRIQKEQLLSSPMDLTGMFKTNVGFTGTPWNRATYPEFLRKHTRERPEIEALTLEVIAKKTKTENSIRILPALDYPAIIETLIRPVDDVLIDVGAIFNGRFNEEVARHILNCLEKRKSSKRGVAFFQNNIIVVLEHTSIGKQIVPFEQSSLNPHERFTYYDQPHTVNVDILQHSFAQGTLTIDKDTALRDVTQGAYRLRELHKHQSLSLAITSTASKYLELSAKLDNSAEKSLFEKIIVFLRNNQQQQLASHLIMATRQKVDYAIKNIVQKYLWQVEFKEKNEKQIIGHIKALKPVVVSLQSVSAWENYGKQQLQEETKKVLARMMEEALSKLSIISEGRSGLKLIGQETLPEKAVQEITASLGNTVDMLPKTLSIQTNENAIAELETETLTQTQTQPADEMAHIPLGWQKISPDPSLPLIFQTETYTSKNNCTVTVSPLVDTYHSAKLKRFAPFLKDLLITSSFKNPTPEGLCQLAQVATQYVLHIYNQEKKSMQLMLLDPISDLTFFWTALSAEQQQTNFPRFDLDKDVLQLCISNLDGKIIQYDSSIEITEAASPFMQAFHAKGALLRLQAKLTTGKNYLSFNKQDKFAFEILTKTHGEQLIKEYCAYLAHL